MFDVVLDVKVRGASDFAVPEVALSGERGDGIISGFALRSLLQRHQVIDVGHEIIHLLALRFIDLLQH